MPQRKSNIARAKTTTRYLDVFEAGLTDAGYHVRRERRQLYAAAMLTMNKRISFLFNTERNGRGDFFGDFHDTRHVTLIAKMIGRAEAHTSVWVYVERQQLAKRNAGGRPGSPSYFFDISTERAVKAALSWVLEDLEQRIIPSYKSYSLQKMLGKGKARKANMAVGFDPVGGSISRREIESIKDPEGREVALESASHYWRRGGMIDLAALLVLGQFDKAAWLMDRMPLTVGYDQGYLVDNERFSDEEWERGRLFAKRIERTLKGGRIPVL